MWFSSLFIIVLILKFYTEAIYVLGRMKWQWFEQGFSVKKVICYLLE